MCSSLNWNQKVKQLNAEAAEHEARARNQKTDLSTLWYENEGDLGTLIKEAGEEWAEICSSELHHELEATELFYEIYIEVTRALEQGHVKEQNIDRAKRIQRLTKQKLPYSLDTVPTRL